MKVTSQSFAITTTPTIARDFNNKQANKIQAGPVNNMLTPRRQSRPKETLWKRTLSSHELKLLCDQKVANDLVYELQRPQQQANVSLISRLTPIADLNDDQDGLSQDKKRQNTPHSNHNLQMARTRPRAACYKLVSSIALLLLCMCLLANEQLTRYGNCAKLPEIYWNSSNPIFRIDNTDHIFDVNKRQNDHDKVDLVCPQHQQQLEDSNKSSPLQLEANNNGNSNGNGSSGSGGDSGQEQERYMIYNVSKEEYDTCRLNAASQARVVAVCDQQQQRKNRPLFTLSFRTFTPQPNGLEFKAGQDYYFITALIGHQNDPHKRFSPCREQNMKVIFRVCCKQPASALAVTNPLSVVAAAASSASSQTAPNSNVQLQPPNNGGNPINKPSLSGILGWQTASTTRRPPSYTLKPTLVPPESFPNEFVKKLDPNGDSNKIPKVAQQQHQPVTVLPIEIITTGDDTGKEVFMNEQPTISPPSPIPVNPPPVNSRDNISSGFINSVLTYPGATSRLNDNQPRPPTDQQRLPPFVPFDPTASPETLNKYGRYSPTPLPSRLTNRPGGQQQPWPPNQDYNFPNKHFIPPKAPPLNQEQRQLNRNSFYPNWPTLQMDEPLKSSRQEDPTPTAPQLPFDGASVTLPLVLLLLVVVVALASMAIKWLGGERDRPPRIHGLR